MKWMWLGLLAVAGCGGGDDSAGEVEVIDAKLHHQVVPGPADGSGFVPVQARQPMQLWACNSETGSCFNLAEQTYTQNGQVCSSVEVGDEPCPGVPLASTEELHVYWWE